VLSPLTFDVVENVYVAIADVAPDSRVLLTGSGSCSPSPR
jgi:hypothetical protein